MRSNKKIVDTIFRKEINVYGWTIKVWDKHFNIIFKLYEKNNNKLNIMKKCGDEIMYEITHNNIKKESI